MISTLMGLAECVLFCYVATMSDLKFSLYLTQCEIYCENGKKIVFCSRFRSYFKGAKPWPRPTALAFQYSRPGQKPSQAKGQAWLGPASGLRPELAHH